MYIKHLFSTYIVLSMYDNLKWFQFHRVIWYCTSIFYDLFDDVASSSDYIEWYVISWWWIVKGVEGISFVLVWYTIFILAWNNSGEAQTLQSLYPVFGLRSHRMWSSQQIHVLPCNLHCVTTQKIRIFEVTTGKPQNQHLKSHLSLVKFLLSYILFKTPQINE